MTPEQYCQEKTGGSGSSFYYSFLFLPPEQRRAITALYAYCREVDDIVDRTMQPEVARATLGWWAHELEEAYAGRPTHPVTRALSPAIERYALDKGLFQEILAGMEMDLTTSRYPDFAALELYCYRVASTVGMLSAAIFGYDDARTLDYARRLGVALQLTNIIRDVGEDARRGRIYLPLDELQRFDVAADALLARRSTGNFAALMAMQAERADTFYRQALDLLPPRDRARQMPGLIMGAIYAATLDEIRNEGFQVLDHKTALTPLRKLWIAWRTARREKRRVGRAA